VYTKIQKMKQVILGLLLLCTVFTSCKKEHTPVTEPTDPTLRKLLFNVGFSETNNLEINRLKTNSTDTLLTNHATILYYAFYNSAGTFLNLVKQTSTDADFGSYTANLKAGAYTVIVAGGITGFTYSGRAADVEQGGTSYILAPPSSLSTDVLLYENTSGEAINFTSDAFYKKLNVTVTNSNQNQTVTLNRITSKVVVNINDAIPANTKSIKATFNFPAYEFEVGSGNRIAAGGSALNFAVFSNITPAQIGTTNFKLSTLILPNSSTFTIDLTALTIPWSSGIYNIDPATIIATKTVNNVTAQPNQITTLSGNLFGGPSATGQNFIPMIDTSWTTTPGSIIFH
jgi:hypothetical protein